MDVSEVREHRQLQQENARLKRLLAERDLEIDVMKERAEKSGEILSKKVSSNNFAEYLKSEIFSAFWLSFVYFFG